jgi:MoxR-like ATPase
MQEKKVTLGGQTYELAAPFLAFATRNPIDSEGVYPLPEAQLDRFLLEIIINYPSTQEEMEIAATDHSRKVDELEPVLSGEELLRFQQLVQEIPVPESVLQKAVKWVRRTRPGDEQAHEQAKEILAWGAGPRASFHLIQAARAHALLFGSGVVEPEDVRTVFPSVIRHRVVPTALFQRSGEEIDALLQQITAA